MFGKKRVLCCLVLLLTFASLLQGSNMRFIHLSNDNQLPSNTINSICQDQKGFIWIGTENGLCRWDGSTMELFEPSMDDSEGLPSKSIVEVFADSMDRIWVITSQGLRFYDYRENRFLSTNNDLSVPSSSCAICEGPGGLYLGIDDILHRYSENDRRFEQVLVQGREVRNRFSSLVVDGNGDVWAGTRTDGLIHLNRTHTAIDHFKANPDTKDWLNSNRITALYYSDDGVIWIGTDDKGVSCYHMDKRSFRQIPELDGLGITSLCEDAENHMWVGTNQGLYVFDRHSNRITAHYVRDPFNPNLLNDNFITGIFRDREQNMLVGTKSGGLNIQPFMYRQFTIFDYGEGEGYLSGRMVRQILPDGNGNLLVATEDGNLNLLMESGKTIRKLLPPGEECLNPCALLMDSKNRLWIGTASNGLFRYSPTTGRYDRFTVEKYPGLSTNSILSLLEDSNGTIWVGTSSGLVLFDESRDIFIQFEPYRFRRQGINHLMMDADADIWISTQSQGVFCYDITQKRVSEFMLKDEDGTILNKNKHVNFVFQDSRHRLWFSTNYDGLVCYDPQRNEYSAFSTDDYLLSNTVYSIIEGSDGTIWASTDNGLSGYDESTKSFVNYSVSEGLPNKQFSNNSAYCSPDGFLYFGTINGLIAFHPDSLRMSANKAQVELIGIRIAGNSGSLSPPEECGLDDGRQIHLSSTQAKSFSVVYTVPTISHASSLFFATRLGSGSEWDYVGTQKQIHFANLAPGEYALQLKASYNNRWEGDEPVLSVTIIVDPPFWCSKLMLCCYVLILILLVVFAWRLSVIKQRRHTERLSEELERKKDKEIQQMQLNFFTMISHQLRIPLSLIMAPLETMIEQGRFSKDMEPKMRQLAVNAGKMKQLIDELLCFTQLKNLQKKLHLRQGDVQSFIHDIADGFQLMAEEKKLTFTINVPQDGGPEVWFSPQDVEKIVFNLLSNAFKYTETGSITITSFLDTSSSPEMLHLSVEDTGIGMEAEKMSHIFEAYYQIDDGGSNRHNGFGIGLALIRELVELHKGTIQVSSTPLKGSRFDIRIGVDRSLFSSDELSQDRSSGLKDYKFLPVPAAPSTYDIIRDEPLMTDSPGKHSVLVVEDEPGLLSFYNELLSSEFHVLLAKNGLEGWETARKKHPDVIISDVMMPEMSGFELVRRLKGDIGTSHIQVILLTAMSGEMSQVEGYKSGADFYLEKPFHPSALLEQVRNLINSREMLIRRHMAGQVDAVNIVNNEIDARFINKLDAVINANLASDALSVNFLVSEVGVSRTQLHLKLKSLVGMSTTEYINHCRIREATTLIRKGYHVSEAAYATGFTSPDYFSRLFRKKYGIPPSVFIENLRKSGSRD